MFALAPGRSARLRSLVLLATLGPVPFLPGCASGPAPSSGATLDPSEAAARAEVANRIPRTSRIEFDWSLQEPNLNVSGKGVVRVQPPDRARLDLFLGEGSSVLAVALVDSDLRMPRGAPRSVVPSAPLLWASFGIFRPGLESVALGAERMDDRVRLRYRLSDGNELHYHLMDDRIVGVEMIEGGTSVHRVDLDVTDPTEMASEAVYRNIPAFRQLRVSVGAVEAVDAFPSTIWRPGRGGR